MSAWIPALVASCPWDNPNFHTFGFTLWALHTIHTILGLTWLVPNSTEKIETYLFLQLFIILSPRIDWHAWGDAWALVNESNSHYEKERVKRVYSIRSPSSIQADMWVQMEVTHESNAEI